jgi:hypothetical protein
MAPSNLSQVFFSNTTDASIQTAAGTVFADLTGTASAVELGFWDVDAGDWLSTAYTGAKRIQVVQGMPSGFPIASPIINVADIKAIKYYAYTATQLHSIAVTPVMVSNITTADQPVMVRIALRSVPTCYESFVNPGSTSLDISTGTSAATGSTKFAFPLVGNHSAGRMIFNIEVPEANGAYNHGNTVAGLCTAVYELLGRNTLLNKMFTVADNTTAFTITARHPGTIFDITLTYSDGTALADTQSITGYDSHQGNYWQAISDEKSMRAKYGNFNRMYFPTSFPEFAQPTYKYDVIDISYAHDHPTSTGIARAAELNNVRIYWGKGSTALSNATDDANTVMDDVLGITTIGTSQVILGSN